MHNDPTATYIIGPEDDVLIWVWISHFYYPNIPKFWYTIVWLEEKAFNFFDFVTASSDPFEGNKLFIRWKWQSFLYSSESQQKWQ